MKLHNYMYMYLLQSTDVNGASVAESGNDEVCVGHERSLAIEATVQLLDMKEEGLKQRLHTQESYLRRRSVE